MAPLPKRKFSTRRSGKRKATRKKTLPKLVKCSNCGKEKLSHRVCKHCQK